jgi:hypothetical protein
MNPCSNTHLIFDKVAKNISWRKNSLSNKYCWGNWISACRKLKLDPCLSPCTSINSKWFKDLNIRPEALKLLHERAGNTFELVAEVIISKIELKWLSNYERGLTNVTTTSSQQKK